MLKIRFAIDYFCNFSGSRGFATFILSVILSANILFISSLFAEMVKIPCMIESPMPIPRHKGFEVTNSGLQIREYLAEPLIKDIKIFRPIRRNGVESFQLRQDSIAECGGGNGKAIQAVVATSEISSNSGHNESPRYLWDMSPDEIDQILHDFAEGMWYGLIAVFIMFLLSAQKAQPEAGALSRRLAAATRSDLYSLKSIACEYFLKIKFRLVSYDLGLIVRGYLQHITQYISKYCLYVFF